MHWRVAVNLLSFLLICVLPMARMQDQIDPRSDVEKQLIDILKARSVRYDWRRGSKRWMSKCLRGKLRWCPDGPALPPEHYLSGSYLPVAIAPQPQGYQAAIYPVPNVVVVSQQNPEPVLIAQPNPSQSSPINILNDVPLNRERNLESPKVVAMSSSLSSINNF